MLHHARPAIQSCTALEMTFAKCQQSTAWKDQSALASVDLSTQTLLLGLALEAWPQKGSLSLIKDKPKERNYL